MWGQTHCRHNSNNLLLINNQITQSKGQIPHRLNSEIFPIVSPVQTREGSQPTGLHNAPLCMSSDVHTSVWLSNLPSPTRSAHTDTPSAGPDGPGCQRMKGESGRKKECERKEVQQHPRTQAHPGFLYQTTTSPQEEQ